MVGLFAIIALLMVRISVRVRVTEFEDTTNQKGAPTPEASEKILDESLQKAALPAIPAVAKLAASDSGVHEWSFGDKPNDMTKPGNHFGATVKVQVTRTK